MPVLQTEEARRVHSDAMRQFDDIQTSMRYERLQCLEDRRFYSIAGAQWEGGLGEQFQNKPRFEVNKVHLAVIRIINEYRNNRIDAVFVSKEGVAGDELADSCQKLYRADEQDSPAEEAKDNAFEEAVGGGFGAWRLRACYEDEGDDENERQRIRFEPIYDADSCVFFDLNSKRQDKSDARHCYVLTGYTPAAYERQFGDSPASWPRDVTMAYFDWYAVDTVYVAEYYEVEEVRDAVHVYLSTTGDERRVTQTELTRDPDLGEELQATGWRLDRTKKVKRKRVHKWLMSGGGVLEDCGYVAGEYIPVIPVFGKRWFVDGVERCMGHVRLCKDAQRLKNMNTSKVAEIAALSPVEKPIFSPEQIAGHQGMWARDNIENNPYLLLNQLEDANGNPMPPAPVAYTKAPEIPVAQAAVLQMAEADLKDMLGGQDAGDQLLANTSGKAVELVQNRLDMQAYIYVSNFAKSVKWSATVWLSMARELYVEDGRRMKGIGSQDEVESIELLRPIADPKTGEVLRENDLARANFDVSVDVGPSSSSRRASTVRALTAMMAISADPETQQVLGAMAMMNMEGEGVSEVREFYRRKLLRMGVVTPTEQEKQELAAEAQAAGARPDPQAQYLEAAAEEAQANAAESRSKTLLNVANAQKSRADAASALADIDLRERQNIADTYARLGEMLGARTVMQ